MQNEQTRLGTIFCELARGLRWNFVLLCDFDDLQKGPGTGDARRQEALAVLGRNERANWHVE
jgi:hypothetical protein